MTHTPTYPYTQRQRLIALGFGIVCHITFIAAVGVMAWMLYTGMTGGWGALKGGAAWIANLLLLLQFPVIHSLLLTDRGGRLLKRLVPGGIGDELRTTVFAIIASLQLLVAFLFWSPLSEPWFSFSGMARWIMSLAYLGSWGLLVKSMADAGLDVQMGYLGWWAVFRGQAPSYKPFRERGTFKYSRHPMYLAYALILWTGTIWGLDHLLMAVGWGAYCLIAPIHKEMRYMRRYGDAFSRYKARVPYLLGRRTPGRKQQHAAPTAESIGQPDAEVLICGAGPIGLLLANLLGKASVSCIVLERNQGLPERSMAIGITPPSLEILAGLGLDTACAKAGVPITHAFVHEEAEELGSLRFDKIPGAHRYIFSLPQSETIRILRENLSKFPSVSLLTGHELEDWEEGHDGITARIRHGGAPHTLRARWLAGCDGNRSRVRELAGIPARSTAYAPRFVMADYMDDSGLGTSAHLYFGRVGSVESFPLPGGLRRWIVMQQSVDDADAGLDWIEHRVRTQVGVELSGKACSEASPFHPRRLLTRSYFRGRAVLCGDAAHVMSPIGGQGMNTGFADAEFLAQALHEILRQDAAPIPVLTRYTRRRQRAFRVASARAARGMWLGTRTSYLGARLRRALIAHVLMRPGIRDQLAIYFAMLNIPFNTLKAVKQQG